METQTAADRSKTISTGFLDGARKNYPREVEYVLVALALAAHHRRSRSPPTPRPASRSGTGATRPAWSPSCCC